MSPEEKKALAASIRSEAPLANIVSLLRTYKARGAAKDEVYSLLEGLRQQAGNDAEEDRILEVSDFVAGFCSPHLKVWD